MSQEVRIAVKLDTKKAVEDLRALGKEGQATAGRIGDQMGSAGGGGGALAALGIGAGVGAGIQRAFSMVSSAAESSIFREAYPIGEYMDLASAGPTVRGSVKARESTKALLRDYVAHGGNVQTAVDYYNANRPRFVRQEEGASKIDRAIKEANMAAAKEAVIRGVEKAFESGTQKLIDFFKSMGR